MTPLAGRRLPAVAAADNPFARDVAHYLGLRPRQLPSRYLYDALGSALFEAICQLPWYSLTRAELRLLRRHAAALVDDDVVRIVELGSGSGDKLAALLAAAGSRVRLEELHLVDLSAAALMQAGRALEPSRLRVVPHHATYEAGLAEIAATPVRGGRTLLLFLGSNIGNFDPDGRREFLRGVRSALRPGDGLLLGTDLIKPEPVLLRAYDDPLGVTAAFNRNLLVRINRELQGTLALDAFGHRAVWNAGPSRIEMHLVSRRPQRIVIPGAGVEFVMARGDWIWTESSYKFDPEAVTLLLAESGFAPAGQWIDTADRFALTTAVAV